MALPKLFPRPDRPSLRDRLSSTAAGLTAAKDRAATAPRVGRAACSPPEPEPGPAPVDRVALVNYATWLFMERRMVCGELYPNAGPSAEHFVAAALAADRFHFPGDGRDWRDVPPPSTRAVQILDLVGVDWRAEAVAENTFDSPFHDAPSPHGWPAPDAALLEALGDFDRIGALLSGIPEPEGRGLDELPEYRALGEARDEAIDTLANGRARGLHGLQAKARAILSDGFRGDDDNPLFIACGLARDLIDAPRNAIEPRPDPILAVIEENRRLLRACEAAERLPQPPGDPDPLHEQEDAFAEQERHLDDVLLKTVPATARGCVALARYAVEHKTSRGLEIDGHIGNHLRIIDLIARSPLVDPNAGGASPAPDPIHAAIAASERADAAWWAYGETLKGRITTRQRKKEDALTQIAVVASNAVLTTIPTTRAGRRALVAFARLQIADYYGEDWLSKALSEPPAQMFMALAAAVEAEHEA